jgi:hypothetical protein
MSIDTVRRIVAEDVGEDDELDLDGDEYGDNELAVYAYATVMKVTPYWDGESDEPMVVLTTSQGVFNFPAGHYLKVKIND